MLSKMSKENLEMLSYAKIAELYLKENKKPMNTADLFREVCKLLDLDEREYEENDSSILLAKAFESCLLPLKRSFNVLLEHFKIEAT